MEVTPWKPIKTGGDVAFYDSAVAGRLWHGGRDVRAGVAGCLRPIGLPGETI
jgi:hypothetical protein